MFGRRRYPKSPSVREVRGRMRGFILDSQIDDPHALSLAVGCPPISDEVADREEEESDKRTERITHLTPLIYAFAHTLANGAINHQRATIEETVELPEEVWKYSQQMVEQMSFAVVMGAVSQMVDMGLLSVVKKKKK